MSAAADGRRRREPAIRLGVFERRLRVGLYFAALVAACLYYEAALRIWAIGFSWVDPAGRQRRFNTLIRQWGVLLCELTLKLLKTELDVVGEVPPGRFVVVSNHQSTADIAILIRVFRSRNCKFVAKRELGRGKPAVSCALSRGGAALIDRDPGREDLRRLRDFARELEAWDGCPVLFAEGTRSRDGDVLPYRTAAVRLVARESGLPLLPVAIDGTWPAADLPGFARDLPGRRGAVYLGRPIPPERWRGREDEALEEIRRWTEDTIEEGRASGRVARPPLPHDDEHAA